MADAIFAKPRNITMAPTGQPVDCLKILCMPQAWAHRPHRWGAGLENHFSRMKSQGAAHHC